MDYIPHFLKPKNENSPLLYSVYLKDSMPSEMGNLNLYKRPQVQNADGSVSTVKSISIGIGDSKSPNKTALIPLIHPDGYEMKNDEAINWYKKTGQHLGVFDSEESASSYAQALHEQQATIYRKK
jgi:tryptophan synthase beta subunit